MTADERELLAMYQRGITWAEFDRHRELYRKVGSLRAWSLQSGRCIVTSPAARRPEDCLCLEHRGTLDP